MKKIYLSVVALVLTTFTYSQTERCGFNHLVNAYEQAHPGYLEAVDRLYQTAVNNANNNYHSTNRASNVEYTIPVVVHIVYSAAEQNLADSVVEDQIATLNEDFLRLNADTVNLRSDFSTIAGNPKVAFKLAEFDPNGNPTTGITRTSTTTKFGENGGFFGPDIENDIERVKSTAEGGIDPWDQSKYLNIWVCDMANGGSPSLLGYATPPANLSNWPAGSTDGMKDGVVIQYQVFGSNNPNDFNNPQGGGVIDVLGRTATHEVGHYLGLRHTAEQAFWGGSCGDDDGLLDTPNCEQSAFNCDANRNACTDDNIINSVGDTLGDLSDMIENFMDYSSEECQNSFTKGQVAIIRDVLDNHRSGLLNNGAITQTPPASINDIQSSLVAGIYPNPNNGWFQISIKNFVSNVDLTIFNELGQTVYQDKVMASETQIDLSNEQKGIYFVRLSNEKNQEIYKLVIR